MYLHRRMALRYSSKSLIWEKKSHSTRALYELFRDTQATAVIHLAFVIDPVRTGVLDLQRMWQINVAGTARVMEAITESNRTADSGVKQFIFPSSVSVYGSNLAEPATEESPLAAHTLPYAIHKKESDEVVQRRSPACVDAACIFCRHIFAGASVKRYFSGSVSPCAQRQERPCGKNARGRQAVALHVAARSGVSRQQNSVHSCRRHGTPGRAHSRTRTGDAAFDGGQCRRTRRTTYLRPLHPLAKAKLIRVPGEFAMKLALRSCGFAEFPRFRPGCSLHDRRIHHEHRSPAAVFSYLNMTT